MHTFAPLKETVLWGNTPSPGLKWENKTYKLERSISPLTSLTSLQGVFFLGGW